jgi:hypothetical protein
METRDPPASGEMESQMNRLVLLAWLACFASPAIADSPIPGGPPLDARAFDALTLGKRMDTFDPFTLYGIEEFLPGQRAIWKDALGCKTATWDQVGDQICFYYEDDPENPDCWIYNIHEGDLWGWYEGRSDGPVVRLVPGDSPMQCEFVGA